MTATRSGTDAGMAAPLTDNQRLVLAMMDRLNVGQVFVDPLGRWVPRNLARVDAAIADAVVAWWETPGVVVP